MKMYVLCNYLSDDIITLLFQTKEEAKHYRDKFGYSDRVWGIREFEVYEKND